MPQVLALEWDDAEARLAVADVRRGSIVLEQAFAVPLDNTAPGSGSDTPAGKISLSGAHDLNAIGRRITEALATRGIRRGKTLVGVGRANIELKNVSVPPCPPEELPEMVRFQAERDFNTLGDDWPLDFLPQPGSGESQEVLAAAISPELVAEIEVTCQAANLTPQRLILRPCAAAALLSRVRPGSEGKLRLLVDLLAEEADLTVLSGDAVVFMRTARLPHEALRSDSQRMLVPEIRRTIAAVHNRLHGQRIEEVFVCGDDSQAAAIREIGRDLELPVEVFNPLKSVTLGGDLRKVLPNQPSRFAPLIGMLLHEAEPGEGIIDFLNPRKRPEKKSRKREFIAIGATVATLAVVAAGWIYYQLGELDAEAASLAKRSNDMGVNIKDKTETPVKKAMLKSDQAAEIERFTGTEVVWLDELAAIALKAPPAEKMMITNLTTPPDAARRTSRMHLDVAAATPEVVKTLTDTLRDKGHQVTPGNAGELENGKRYPWAVKVDLQIDPAKNDLAAALNEETVAKAADGKAAESPANGGKSNGRGRGPREGQRQGTPNTKSTENKSTESMPADSPNHKAGSESEQEPASP
jgi:Tfp pilus assembly PilM family ATPase